MSHWLYPANIKYYDVFGAFEQDTVYWPMNSKVEAADIVYIYLAAPYKQIAFQCEVVDINLDQTKIFNKLQPFIKGENEAPNKQKPFMQLTTINKLPLRQDSLLCLAQLKENGLRGMLMGPRKLNNNPTLLNYITGVA